MKKKQNLAYTIKQKNNFVSRKLAVLRIVVDKSTASDVATVVVVKSTVSVSVISIGVVTETEVVVVWSISFIFDWIQS